MDEKDYNAFILKYTPSELDELKSKIRSARFSYIITDPFPELTEWHNRQQNKNAFEKIMDEKLGIDPEPKITPHKAYHKGMEFMWSLIEPLVK